jgi:hypothetical protein
MGQAGIRRARGVFSADRRVGTVLDVYREGVASVIGRAALRRLAQQRSAP